MAKKRRTAAQRAATAKMIAANRARRGSRKSKPRRAKSRRRSSNPVAALFTRRRRSSSSARRSSPRRARRRSRNPIGVFRDFTGQLVPSAVGGVGALGLDVLLGLPFIPDQFKTGALRPVARIAGAVGVGAVAGMVMGKRIGNQVAAGALTVVLYDTMKAALARVAGGKIPGIGMYDIPGIGMYEVSPEALAYADAGMQAGAPMLPDNTTVAAYVE